MAHVIASVNNSDLTDDQGPSVLVVVSHSHLVVVGDDVVVDRKDGFVVFLDPGDLHAEIPRSGIDSKTIKTRQLILYLWNVR